MTPTATAAPAVVNETPSLTPLSTPPTRQQRRHQERQERKQSRAPRAGRRPIGYRNVVNVHPHDNEKGDET